MKKIFVLMLATTLAFGCTKDALETFPPTTVTQEFVYGNVENANSALTGSLTTLGTFSWTQGYSSGLGFGLTTSYLTGEALAEDYVLSGQGSGWMWQTYAYVLKNWFDDERLQCSTEWNCYYTTINSMNTLIGSAELLKASVEGKAVLGQAYAVRALCYHMLAQLFARAYYYYPEDLCVPVYTEPTTSTTKGQPRSTNKVVYEEVIYPDLNEAVALLKAATDGGWTRSSKMHLDYYVVNGLKARVALCMHKWEDAYTAAEEALKGYAGNECLTGAQLTSGLNDINALGSVMWGMVHTTDTYGMYASYLSQMDAGHDGYAQKARRCCSAWMWNQMNETDARRAWWLGNFDNAKYESAGEKIKYCQVKFKFQANSWLGDYVYMRAEEMLLTAAEAYCHAGNDSAAKAHLMKLMSNRDTAYTCDLTGNLLNGVAVDGGQADNGLTLGSDGGNVNPSSLLEEILVQRRIELWGEFGRLFDIKRLGQGFKRAAVASEDNPEWPASALVSNSDTQSPGTFAWVLLIPQLELDGNPNIIQNPTGDKAE